MIPSRDFEFEQPDHSSIILNNAKCPNATMYVAESLMPIRIGYNLLLVATMMSRSQRRRHLDRSRRTQYLSHKGRIRYHDRRHPKGHLEFLSVLMAIKRIICFFPIDIGTSLSRDLGILLEAIYHP
jgi:hypothetical protein